MASLEQTLPNEMWQRVLLNVPPSDLLGVMVTSRHMSKMASWPPLWAGMEVRKSKIRDNGLEEFYSIDRFKKITKLDFSIPTTRQMFSFSCFNLKELTRLMNDIPQTPLENVDLTRMNLSSVPASLLSRAVSRLRTANLRYTRLTTDQSVQVLAASLLSNTLLHLNLRGVKLNQIPAELLSRTICRLQTVQLGLTGLTTDQCAEVLEAILLSGEIIHVDLEAINLSGVPAELLADAVKRLQMINLGTTSLTCEQCVKLLKTSLSSSKLVQVDLSCVNLGSVPPELLAAAVCRLEAANLNFTSLTTQQCDKVLEASLSSNTLGSIALKGADLREVPVELLARVASRLHSVNLESAQITHEQS